MSDEFTSAELEAYLDEVLPIERMAEIEMALRKDAALGKRLAATNGRRDAGVHSIGEIWRRHRLSCPPREQLGSYLLGVLPAEAADYVTFHVKEIACRYCAASLEDLRSQQAANQAGQIDERRKRYFQSSAGYLRRED
jgi:hypothetical protein